MNDTVVDFMKKNKTLIKTPITQFKSARHEAGIIYASESFATQTTKCMPHLDVHPLPVLVVVVSVSRHERISANLIG